MRRRLSDPRLGNRFSSLETGCEPSFAILQTFEGAHSCPPTPNGRGCRSTRPHLPTATTYACHPPPRTTTETLASYWAGPGRLEVPRACPTRGRATER